jgi:ankyrin repeat protein
MTVGEFLCFAAIEYDDLQSFKWLVESNGASKSINCYGWNLMHVCARFGREEIVGLMLLDHDVSIGLAEAFCETMRSPHGETPHQSSAVQISVIEGFTNLANYLLDAGCSSVDAKGLPVYLTVSKASKFDHAKQWAKEKQKPFQLEKDIRKLYQLLPDVTRRLDEMKNHLRKSRCMDIIWWLQECDFRKTTRVLGKRIRRHSRIAAKPTM